MADTRCVCHACLGSGRAEPLCLTCYLCSYGLCSSCERHYTFCVHCGAVDTHPDTNICDTFCGKTCAACRVTNIKALVELGKRGEDEEDDLEVMECVLDHTQPSKDPLVLYKASGIIVNEEDAQEAAAEEAEAEEN